MQCPECYRYVDDIKTHIKSNGCNLTYSRLINIGLLNIEDILNTTTIESIEEIEYDDDVFDIEVMDNHNYFANGHLAHNCNKLVLQGVFGPAHRVTTTKALMDNKKLAELKITSLILKYDEELRKNFKNMTYQQEMDLLVSNEKRNKFIRNLTLKCTGNTLLLFQYVEKHGKILHELIATKADENRKVFFIHGGTHVSDREAIRKIVAQESDAIIIASFGVYSAGIDVPSIENVIFASPSKSKIRNLQSIGRGLRLKDGKTHCNLYDIADDLSYKSWKNHTLKHAAERYKLYTEEQFKIQLIEVPL